MIRTPLVNLCEPLGRISGGMRLQQKIAVGSELLDRIGRTLRHRVNKGAGDVFFDIGFAIHQSWPFLFRRCSAVASCYLISLCLIKLTNVSKYKGAFFQHT